MPKPVCVRCCLEMQLERNGHVVELMAGKEPYQLWHGDRFRCPECLSKVVTGFGHAPLSEHYHDCYQRDLQQALVRGDFTRIED